MSRLQTEGLTLAYTETRAVVEALSLQIPDGAVTAIVGPNGCGKSTLLKALGRLIAPRSGAVLLDGKAIHRLPTREVARQLGLLPQSPEAPEAIVVEDLVHRGRYPHQSVFQPPSKEDREAVERALARTGLTALRDRPVDELSGGQRQRAWIAMALAQETPILLLDEPTTYLDLAHQQEVLELIRRLSREEGQTVVVVLHDVNHAAWVADYAVALCHGRVVAAGPPHEVFSPGVLQAVFGVPCDVLACPGFDCSLCLPRGRTLHYVPGDGAAPAQPAPALRAEGLTLGYGGHPVVVDLSVTFPAGKVSAIVGPNGCGKSTLLRALAGLLPPARGQLYLGDRPLHGWAPRARARQVGLLPQLNAAPPHMSVDEVVALGRYPYQRWYRQWTRADLQAMERAMEATGVLDLRWRPLASLSGGQRQRVWLAMALAQETPILLLDEPTSFLDMAHQVAVLDLVREMNRREGRTVIMVLHDLDQASQYADFVVAMKEGRLVAAGPPSEVIREDLVEEVFGVRSTIFSDPATGAPVVMLQALARGAG